MLADRAALRAAARNSRLGVGLKRDTPRIYQSGKRPGKESNAAADSGADCSAGRAEVTPDGAAGLGSGTEARHHPGEGCLCAGELKGKHLLMLQQGFLCFDQRRSVGFAQRLAVERLKAFKLSVEMSQLSLVILNLGLEILCRKSSFCLDLHVGLHVGRARHA